MRERRVSERGRERKGEESAREELVVRERVKIWEGEGKKKE